MSLLLVLLARVVLGRDPCKVLGAEVAVAVRLLSLFLHLLSRDLLRSLLARALTRSVRSVRQLLEVRAVVVVLL
jgi:hypothetical protein